MKIILPVLLLGLSALVWAAGRNEQGPFRYKGIHWIVGHWEKSGRAKPDWIQENQIFRIWMASMAGSLLVLIWYGMDIMGIGEEEVTRLERPVYGSGSYQEELEMKWKEEDGPEGKEQIVIEVEERKLTQKERDKMFHEILEQMGNRILADNTSADRVTGPLHLVEEVEGYPVSVAWISSHPQYVSWDGRLGEDIPAKGTLVCLTAVLRIEEEERIYTQYIKVYPPIPDSYAQVQRVIKEENNTAGDGWLRLPSKLGDRNLIWGRSREDTGKGLTLLAFLCPILLFFREKQAARKKEKEVHQQMLRDYPEIISKLTLLLSAGMSLRRSVERIAKDYVNRKEKTQKRKAYEELLDTCRDMERGVSEKEAYQRLGERCGLLPYRTLSALLVQHLQKGSQGMGQMLEEEAKKAQELRQQQARILGEQASTKLLVPMIFMLLVVFVILIVPAWLSFI